MIAVDEQAVDENGGSFGGSVCEGSGWFGDLVTDLVGAPLEGLVGELGGAGDWRGWDCVGDGVGGGGGEGEEESEEEGVSGWCWSHDFFLCCVRLSVCWHLFLSDTRY